MRFLDSDRVALAVCHASPPHLPLFQNEINKESGKKEHLNTNQKNTPVPVGHADDVITRLFPSPGKAAVSSTGNPGTEV